MKSGLGLEAELGGRSVSVVKSSGPPAPLLALLGPGGPGGPSGPPLKGPPSWPFIPGPLRGGGGGCPMGRGWSMLGPGGPGGGGPPIENPMGGHLHVNTMKQQPCECVRQQGNEYTPV